MNNKKKVKKGDQYENSGTVILKSIEITQVRNKLCQGHVLPILAGLAKWWKSWLAQKSFVTLIASGELSKIKVV